MSSDAQFYRYLNHFPHMLCEEHEVSLDDEGECIECMEEDCE